MRMGMGGAVNGNGNAAQATTVIRYILKPKLIAPKRLRESRRGERALG
jgi:hypothetical protein